MMVEQGFPTFAGVDDAAGISAEAVAARNYRPRKASTAVTTEAWRDAEVAAALAALEQEDTR